MCTLILNGTFSGAVFFFFFFGLAFFKRTRIDSDPTSIGYSTKKTKAFWPKRVARHSTLILQYTGDGMGIERV